MKYFNFPGLYVLRENGWLSESCGERRQTWDEWMMSSGRAGDSERVTCINIMYEDSYETSTNEQAAAA